MGGVYQQMGGAKNTDSPEEQVNKFVKYLNINASKESLNIPFNSYSKVINKSVFVNAIFDIESAKSLRKRGVFNDIYGVYKNLKESMAIAMSSVTTQATQSKQAELQGQFEVLLQDMKKNNQILPLIFKNVSGFGFLNITIQEKTTGEEEKSTNNAIAAYTANNTDALKRVALGAIDAEENKLATRLSEFVAFGPAPPAPIIGGKIDNEKKTIETLTASIDTLSGKANKTKQEEAELKEKKKEKVIRIDNEYKFLDITEKTINRLQYLYQEQVAILQGIPAAPVEELAAAQDKLTLIQSQKTSFTTFNNDFKRANKQKIVGKSARERCVDDKVILDELKNNNKARVIIEWINVKTNTYGLNSTVDYIRNLFVGGLFGQLKARDLGRNFPGQRVGEGLEGAGEVTTAVNIVAFLVILFSIIGLVAVASGYGIFGAIGGAGTAVGGGIGYAGSALGTAAAGIPYIGPTLGVVGSGLAYMGQGAASGIAGAYGAGVGTAQYLVGTVGAAGGGALISESLTSRVSAAIYGILYFIINIVQCSSNNMSTDEIIDNLLLTQIFNKITEIRYLETENFITNSAVEIFNTSIESDVGGFLNATSFLFRPNLSSGRSYLDRDTEVYRSFNPDISGLVTKEENVLYYSETIAENRDIKSKLVNINIPMQCFYYALTQVKSTYDKQTGSDLKLYYDNKDKFMKEYKERKK